MTPGPERSDHSMSLPPRVALPGIARTHDPAACAALVKDSAYLAVILEIPSLANILARKFPIQRAPAVALEEEAGQILLDLVGHCGTQGAQSISELPPLVNRPTDSWHFHPNELTVIGTWSLRGTEFLERCHERLDPGAVADYQAQWQPDPSLSYIPDSEVARLQLPINQAPLGSLLFLKGFEITPANRLRLDRGAIHRTPKLEVRITKLDQQYWNRDIRRGLVAYGGLRDAAALQQFDPTLLINGIAAYTACCLKHFEAMPDGKII